MIFLPTSRTLFAPASTLLVLLLMLPTFSRAQEFAWERTYSPIPEGAFGNDANALVPTDDGGALLVCSVRPGPTTLDYRLTTIRINADGDSLWMRSAGTPRNIMVVDAFRRGGGAIVFGGATGLQQDTGTDLDIYVAAIDSAGGLLWEKGYGDPWDEYVTAVRPTLDGGFLILGMVARYTFAEYAMVMKVGADGELQWRREFPTIKPAYAGLPLEEGGYALIGSTGRGSTQKSDLFMLRLDAAGDSLWYRTIPTDPKEYGISMLRIGSAYVIVGMTSERTALLNPLVVHTDLEFRPLFRYVVGDTADQKRINDLKPIPGGYLAAGIAENLAGFSKPYFVRLDALGAVVDERRIEPADSLPRRPLRLVTFGDGSALASGASGAYLYSQPWAARIDIAVTAVDELYHPEILEIDLR